MYVNASVIEFCISMAANFLPNLFSSYRFPEASSEGRTIRAMRLSASSSPTKRKVLIVGGARARFAGLRPMRFYAPREVAVAHRVGTIRAVVQHPLIESG